MLTLRRILLDGGELQDRGPVGINPALVAAVYTTGRVTVVSLASGENLHVRESVEAVIRMVSDAPMPQTESLAA